MAREERRHCRAITTRCTEAAADPVCVTAPTRAVPVDTADNWCCTALHGRAAPRPTDRPIRLSMNPAACAICTLPQSSRARRIWVPAAYLTRSVFRLHGTLPCPLSSGHAMRAVPAPRCRSHSRRGTPRCQVRLPAAPQRRPQLFTERSMPTLRYALCDLDSRLKRCELC